MSKSVASHNSDMPCHLIKSLYTTITTDYSVASESVLIYVAVACDCNVLRCSLLTREIVPKQGRALNKNCRTK